ncbi:uncharacterized protein LTR77_007513 [Saxophila tyrrhenica]|uniref:SigF-like NTF2-like domain-containing protein n=1 Tax=Saxophila tyrrhenica TaxID=1690608 RepID=A0AAV9P8A2_9PEZI|nr:hypothetical protein LTR77_007513 [Saxophila tyrrhenica]
MDDPINDIPQIIYNLTTAPSSLQQKTLERYFTPDASFTHPFCAVHNNRQAILRIFQWYKILSPDIKIRINSVAYDQEHMTLYVNLSQLFAIWFIPFHRSPVTLTTVLTLAHGHALNTSTPPPKNPTPHSQAQYFITSQNDLYQVDQFVRFFLPWGLGTTVIAVWHWVATLVCVVGAKVLQPVQWVFAELSRPLGEELEDGDGVGEEGLERLGMERRGLDVGLGLKARRVGRSEGVVGERSDEDD